MRRLEWAIGESEHNTPHLVGSPTEGGDFVKWSAGKKLSFTTWEGIPLYVRLRRAGELSPNLTLGGAEHYVAAAERMASEIRKHVVTSELLCGTWPPSASRDPFQVNTMWHA